MTIFILDNDPKECAKSLDDKSLNTMIKDIAQVLCNVHWLQPIHTILKSPQAPLQPTKHLGALNNKNFNIRHTHMSSWTKWARECKANYVYLVELGLACSYELEIYRKIRNNTNKKYAEILRWARDNIPDLPDKDEHALFFGTTYAIDTYGKHTYLPLVMPKKYICIDNKSGTVTELFAKIFEELRDVDDIIESYCNYYGAKLKQKRYRMSASIVESDNIIAQWTKRTKPEWLNI